MNVHLGLTADSGEDACLRRLRGRERMARWPKGERTAQYLIDKGRLENIEAEELADFAKALIKRAALRLETTAVAALVGGDDEGAYVAAYDAYRISAEALLACQGLRATSGEGAHVAVEDVVSAQFAVAIPAFAKPTFERFRRGRHGAQYFDPGVAAITKADASWAIEKAAAALAGARRILTDEPPGRFVIPAGQGG